ncbi:uncharacterized protein LOC117105111 [Anneissia japonica]|uniref:uncharacterized protein LOC117105111 n=1 Tax=Anneissia japonica TaxID=1529436 RepID=UPI001425A615|nr:uncharacterized protein LOC117105111 [Anneissia japonica]
MSVRQQRTKIPREALMYFPGEESLGIVKTNLITGDMYAGADVDVLWEGKLVPATIREMSNNPHELLSLQRELLRKDKRKRDETSDSSDEHDVATTSIKKINPKTPTSKTSRRIKGKKSTNKVIHQNSMSVRKQRSKIPREALVYFPDEESLGILKTCLITGDLYVGADVDVLWEGQSVPATIRQMSNNPHELLSLQWELLRKDKRKRDETSDSSDNYDDVATSSIKKTNFKTSTSKTSKRVKGKEIPSVDLLLQSESAENRAIQEGDKCPYGEGDFAAMEATLQQMGAPEWFMEYAITINSRVLEIINMMSELRDQRQAGAVPKPPIPNILADDRRLRRKPSQSVNQ